MLLGALLKFYLKLFHFQQIGKYSANYSTDNFFGN